MLSAQSFASPLNKLFFRLSTALVLLLLVGAGIAQTTVGTGSIVGTVVDPTGAVVSGARVKITNVATGAVINLTTNSSGAYNSGALVPGNYKSLIAAKGFRSSEVALTVLVGNTANGNVKLEIGQENQIVEVQGSLVQVNTEQATVQGVLNAEQIENLPVNGRNFLDLAQLEPGVQIQDGQDFDPTKAAIRRFHSAVVLAAPRGSRWTGLMCRTRPWAPRPRTFPPAAFKSSS